MEDKIALLRKAELFSQLGDDELRTIAEYSEFRDFKDSEAIFRKGTFGESLFIVDKGEVRIMSADDKNREIAHFISGELIGDLDLFENAPRPNTALAEMDTRLLAFPAQGENLLEILEKHPTISARILHKLIATLAGRIRLTNKLVSEKTEWVESIRKQMLYDKLTGLLNRNYIEEDFPLQLTRLGQQTSIIVAKPDQFKYINDTYGHSAGDKSLRAMADNFKFHLPDSAIAVRYRGDEFVAILPDTDQEKAEALCAELLEVLNALDYSAYIQGDSFKTSWSLGLAVFPVHGDGAFEVVKLAFDAMLNMRGQGGGGFLPADKL
ncbi:MAG: GGDEF domain-containing protein [Spirochaetales bacterium]|nr:GGDEF domain-containing protein [Spirochaetales bacterium]